MLNQMADTTLNSTIQVRLPKHVLDKIDALVDHKRGHNRSDVIRNMIMNYLEKDDS